MPTIVNELEELVKQGAKGDPELPSTKACNIILQEGYLGIVGWPEKPKSSYHEPVKKTYAPRPGDKGHKMNAKKAGLCNICSATINVDDDIYFKSGEGACHVSCKDSMP